jgi:glycosyltransferase involved in cell wall biosynthesis
LTVAFRDEASAGGAMSKIDKIEMSDRELGRALKAQDAPRVSILLCTRNRAEQLAGALKSLQEIKSSITWEAIILDNGSTDATKAVITAACAADARLRYAYEGRPGLGTARDTGWRLAHGEIIALSDDDCYFRPDFVDCVWQVFAEHPDVGVVGGRILLFDPDDAPLTIDTRTEPVRTAPRTIVRTGGFHGANLSFRRQVLQAIDGFDHNLGAGTPFPAEDIDAVAAAIWAGYAGLYDPRPTIHHHHRRKLKDVPRQVMVHDTGRGAYYAKFVFRPDSRRAYLTDWQERYGSFFRPRGAKRLAAEMRGALRYALRHGKLSRQIVFGSLFAAVWGLATGWRALDALTGRLAASRHGHE